MAKGMKLFDTYEEALDVARQAIRNFSSEFPVSAAQLANPNTADKWAAIYQKTNIVIERPQPSVAGGAALSLVHVAPPVLFDVPSHGDTIISSATIITDEMLVERTYRPVKVHKDSRGRVRRTWSQPFFATPLIWKNGDRPGPNSSELAFNRLRPGTRPDRVRDLFNDRLTVLQAQIEIGQDIAVGVYGEDAHPYRELPTYWGGTSRHRLIEIDGKLPEIVSLGTVIGISLHHEPGV